MLIDRFLGRRPSHFEINPIVKAYIISESFLWSAWDFVTPIFAVFIVKDIPGGTIQTVAMSYSVYLITRVIFELITGRVLQNSGDKKKFVMSILGILCLSLAYLGFAFTTTMSLIFIFYAVLGIGLGVAAPAKNALFSIHLDRNKESTEWSLTDAFSFICMAMATVLGGFIATQYGFQKLFLLACIINTVSTIPYFLYMSSYKKGL